MQKKRRARTTGKDSDWHKYYDLKKIAQYECCLAYSNYISNLKPAIKNSGHLLRVSTKIIVEFHHCIVIQVATTDDDLAKAKLLNNQFASVFTRENTNMIPTLSGTPFPDMDHIEITVDGVTNLLSNLKSNKAGGHCKIS